MRSASPAKLDKASSKTTDLQHAPGLHASGRCCVRRLCPKISHGDRCVACHGVSSRRSEVASGRHGALCLSGARLRRLLHGGFAEGMKRGSNLRITCAIRSLEASHVARRVACHGVRSQPVPVALVGECSGPWCRRSRASPSRRTASVGDRSIAAPCRPRRARCQPAVQIRLPVSSFDYGKRR